MLIIHNGVRTMGATKKPPGNILAKPSQNARQQERRDYWRNIGRQVAGDAARDATAAVTDRATDIIRGDAPTGTFAVSDGYIQLRNGTSFPIVPVAVAGVGILALVMLAKKD